MHEGLPKGRLRVLRWLTSMLVALAGASDGATVGTFVSWTVHFSVEGRTAEETFHQDQFLESFDRLVLAIDPLPSPTHTWIDRNDFEVGVCFELEPLVVDYLRHGISNTQTVACVASIILRSSTQW